jgi:hypothetical protein
MGIRPVITTVGASSRHMGDQMSSDAKRKPSRAASNMNSMAALTDRHAKRMLTGRVESKPSDYADRSSSAVMQRLGLARRALEERQVLRELGLLDP